MDWIIDLYSNNDLIAFFFWGPVIVNSMVYPLHLWLRVQRDRAAVKKYNNDLEIAQSKNHIEPYFSDHGFVTIGTIVKYFLLTVVPIVNALATIFHAAPIAWDYLSERFAWLFQVKLVKAPEKK